MYTYGSIIIFLGPPGSGKGTQAARLSSELQIPAISTGEILRQACRSGSDLGNRVRSVLESGQLVADELMNQVVSERLLQRDCHEGCILDGYPRTASQARYLSEWLDARHLPPPCVVDFRLAPREIVKRLSRRRQCSQCGRIFGPSPRTGAAQAVCDIDGSALSQRADDRPDVILERLELYRQNAEALVRYFQGPNYCRLRASGSPDKISLDLLRALGVSRTEPQLEPRTAVTSHPAYGL